jgi:two-component system chemotaxis response regulator CheB
MESRMAGIIVMGASAGGFHALISLVSALPADLPVPVAIVLHIGSQRSQLAEILQRNTSLPVTWAAEGLPLRPGSIYVAPPDHHLTVDGERTYVARGPRENLARPAIDPLFRSAARSFGAGAIGVILTGRLNDGTSGLLDIKRQGGVAVVQDPDTAEQPSMPRSALKYVEVDHVAPLQDIAALLAELAQASRASATQETTSMQKHTPMPEPAREFTSPVALICPDCGGALRREGGAMLAYVCHTGHRVTGKILAAQQLEQVERHVESTMRLLHEAAALAADFQAAAAENGDAAAAHAWQQSEAKVRAALQEVVVLGAHLPRPDDLEAA